MLRHLTALLLVALISQGCTPRDRAEGELQAYVSVAPLQHVAQQVLAGRGSANALFAGGQDPHTISLAPSQIKALSSASVYFSAGLAFEESLIARFRGQAHPRFVVLLGGEHTEDAPAHPHDHDHHGHEHAHSHDDEHSDPHLWLSPRHLVLAADTMRETYGALDPEGAEAYHAAFREFAMQVADAAEEARILLQPYEGRRFYIQHGALDYFADYFGLEQAALEAHGREPTARQLAGLVEQARAEGVKVVFAQKGQNEASAQVFAKAIGAEVWEVDAVAGEPVENIRAIAMQLARAFQLQEAQ